MRIQRSWVLRVLAILAVVFGVRQAGAQSLPNYGPAAAGPAGAAGYAAAPGQVPRMPSAPYAAGPTGYGPQMAGAQPGGYQPAAYYDSSAGAAPQSLTPMPATPMGESAAAGPMGGPGMGMGMCQNCGGYGCEMCLGAHDMGTGYDNFDFSVLEYLLPYGAGGYCAQRWFDIQADYIYLRRDNMPANQAFSMEGREGPIVLELNDLDLDKTSGFRTTAAVQLGAGDVFEASYLGGFNWSSQAQVTSNDNLFSVMSDFGEAPPGGFDDTDEASEHRIAYSSDFDTVELNYRQRWVAPNCRVQGSWLVGVRYMNLAEDLHYVTLSPGGRDPGWMRYEVGASNNMTGAQTGGDLWVTVIPGLQLGTEVKVGIYGNHARQVTQIDARSFMNPINEDLKSDRVAFLGDFNVTLLWRLSQNWTLRGGYMAMYADGVALAPNSFNAAPPFVAGERTPFINASGDVFYHGLTAGLEWMW